MFLKSFLSSFKGKGSLIIIIIIAIFNIFSDCSESSSPSDPTSGSDSFLMGYFGGGDMGDEPGIVKVTSNGSVFWVSGYYPYHHSTDYVDMNNGRIAMAVEYPPDGVSPIAYMDIDDITNIKFVPVPQTNDEDYYWAVPVMKPQVMSDGRIIFKVVYNTTNPYDDYHDGMLAIYDPVKDEFEFSGSLTPFILAQPEQGSDTEGGSMGSSFALSPDDSFVCLHAYGCGTDMGQYHVDHEFIVKYDLVAKEYSRVLEGSNTVIFISRDNNYVIANLSGKKYKVNVNDGSMVELNNYDSYICVGQYGKKTDKFFKVWRGSGMSLLDVNEGWLYNPILGDSLKPPYRGLGHGGQFSADESKIYFTASKDFHTNYRMEFAVYSTPLSLGKTDSNPDSLFVLPAAYNLSLFLLLHK